jgi:hypothetical protein
MLLKSYLGGDVYECDDVNLAHYQAVSPWPVKSLQPWQEVQVRGAALFHLAVIANNRQVLVKTHNMHGEVAGMPLFAPAFVRRVVYMVRDPRDVACSMTNHFGITAADAVAFMGQASRLDDPQRALQLLGSWSQHVMTWTDKYKQIQPLVVRYEDLHNDTPGKFSEILTFMDWPIEAERVAKAVDGTQFDKLQADEQRDGFEGAGKGAFFRSGRPSGWLDELAPELARQIEADHGEVMREHGYELEGGESDGTI